MTFPPLRSNAVRLTVGLLSAITATTTALALSQDGVSEKTVEDRTEGSQLRGEQVMEAHGIWYTQVSGIWQTVWLETLAPRYIEDLTIRTDLEDDKCRQVTRQKIAVGGS